MVSFRPVKSRNQKVLKLARSQILRPRELACLGVTRKRLSSLVASGELLRTARGLYLSPELAITEHHSLAEAAKRFPQAVICLLSALQFHELSLEMPHQIWIALPKGARIPRPKDMSLRVMRFSEPAFSEGIETHRIEGVEVKIYSPAKTVADCFKFRNKITTAVAYEALQNAWKENMATAAQLVRSAKTCRVYNVMRPYLETLG
jgi:predicted transcriptional regulator of viral defense system